MQKFGLPYAWSLLRQHVRHWASRWTASARQFEYKSLRRVVDKDIGSITGDTAATLILRKGR
jgi:hypothetical protein